VFLSNFVIKQILLTIHFIRFAVLMLKLVRPKQLSKVSISGFKALSLLFIPNFATIRDKYSGLTRNRLSKYYVQAQI
jgi:putative effector of murein hydrolase LrgA (UPF0299 family)